LSTCSTNKVEEKYLICEIRIDEIVIEKEKTVKKRKKLDVKGIVRKRI